MFTVKYTHKMSDGSVYTWRLEEKFTDIGAAIKHLASINDIAWDNTLEVHIKKAEEPLTKFQTSSRINS